MIDQETLRARALDRVLWEAAWKNERVANKFRSTIWILVGIAMFAAQPSATPFVHLGWGVLVLVLDATWMKRTYRPWFSWVLTTVDLVVLVLGMHAGYLQLRGGDPLFAEHHLTGTAVGTMVVLGVNVMRFSYKLTIWSALVACAGYLWIRLHHHRFDPLSPVDLFLFGSLCAMLVYSSRRFESILGRTMLDLRSIQEARLSSLSRLVAGIAHEMNSPLGVMKTNAQLVGRVGEIVRTTPPAEKKFERALDSLDQAQKASAAAVERMASIVESLRKFSRLDQAEVQVVELRECLDTCLQLLSAETKARIQIVRKFPAEPTHVGCRPAHLNQAFMNVLENAVQAIEKEGTIELRMIKEMTETRIEIADTGRGMPPEKLAQIFDPTFSAGRGRTKMGFGLATCHAIVGDHGGTIRIESEVGKGTTVIITIP